MTTQAQTLASAIDDFVGERIRERRRMLGLSQRALADQVGVSDQDIHKYERGIHRVSAGRLYEIARALETPIDYFFEGVDNKPPGYTSAADRVLREVAYYFVRIRTDEDREELVQFVRTLAGR
jgi:transcriptional regulator with XRE-family HTH domain